MRTGVLKGGVFSLGFSVMVAGFTSLSTQAQIYVPVPVPRDYHGAFAYSKSANYSGWAQYYSNRHEAEEDALLSCRESGAQDCTIVLWFKNKCGSLASSAEGTFGLGTGGVSYLAEQEALEECDELRGRSCRTKKTICAR